MKSWKKRWKDELDKITPDLREDVLNAPVNTVENSEHNGGITAAKSLDKRKLIPVIAAVTALLLCAVILCVCLIKPKKLHGDFLFTLEINPAVTMVSDGNGIVTGVIASNSDADIILSDENVRNNIKGKSLSQAVTYYADCAAKLGYINLDKTGSAVRISGLGGGDFLEEAQTALEAYFTSKGVFALVIAENVDKEEFSLRSGISSDLSAEDTAKFVKQSKALFSDRKAEDLDLQDLQSLYNELIVADKLFNYVTDSLTENIERIIKNARDIQALSRLYFDILNHDDNPLKPFGDYWLVKKSGRPLSGELSALMEEMETALNEYKTDYGIEITGAAELTEATNSYLKLPANSLKLLLENFSFDKFEEISAEITEILKISGLISDGFASYLELPQSLEEYLIKTTEIISSEFTERLTAYGELYNKYRQPIEKADYETYKQDIISRYGSLNAYWQAIKN